MAATGATPLQLYYSTTPTNAPLATNLAFGELALNIADGKLYYKDNVGGVQLLASKAGSSGTFANITVTGTATIDTVAATTLGVSGTSTLGQTTISSGTISATIVTRVTAVADSNTITFNLDTTDMVTQVNTQASGTLTINAPTGTFTNGQKFMLRLKTTNQQLFAWNAAFSGTSELPLPIVTTGSGKYDYMGFVYNATTGTWQMLAKVFGF